MSQKNSRRRQTVVAVLLACSLSLTLNAAVGQAAAPPEEKVVRVYQLKHVDPQTVLVVLQRVTPDAEITLDDRPNRLIVVGSPSTHERVQEVLKTLDVPADDEKFDPTRLQVYYLRNVAAPEALKVLASMLPSQDSKGVRMSADESMNTLVVLAPLETHLHIRLLLDKLDVAPDREEVEQIQVFNVFHGDPGLLAETAARFCDSESVTISVDPRTNAILAKGPAEDLEVMEAILERLDQEETSKGDGDRSTMYRVRVVWLVSGLSNDGGAEPAEDLKEVVAEMSNAGITGLRQVGQVMVHTLADGRFQIECSPMLDKGPTAMKVSGDLVEQDGSSRMHFQISATQIVFLPPAPLESQSRTIEHKGIIDLETEIVAPHGHFVVLGVTPVGTTTSVFVVQVTPK